MSQPQYSPDGRWWWDGQQWIPVQATRAPTKPATGKMVALGIALVVIPAFVALASSAQGAREAASSFVIALIIEVAYFLPTLVASLRNAPNTGSILVLNLFFGWSILGWIIPLAMAVRSKPT